MSTIGEWVWQTGVKKGVAKGIQLVVAWLTAIGLESWGIKIDINALTLAVFGILEIARNFLKVKFPKYFGWL